MRLLIPVILLLISGCDSNEFRTISRPDRVGSRSTAATHEEPYSYPTGGLLAYFPFDGDPSDVSTSLHRGLSHGGAYVADRKGRSGSAMWFDGVDDYITVSESNLLQVQLPVSLSFWVRPAQVVTTSAAMTTSYDSVGNTGVFAAFDSHGSNPSISIGAGGEGFGAGSRRTLHAAAPLEADTWYHIVGVVYSVDAMELYVDGIRVQGNTDGGATELRYGSGPVTFGRRVASGGDPPIYFKGALDDVLIYGVALTQSDVTYLFNGK